MPVSRDQTQNLDQAYTRPYGLVQWAKLFTNGSGRGGYRQVGLSLGYMPPLARNYKRFVAVVQHEEEPPVVVQLTLFKRGVHTYSFLARGTGRRYMLSLLERGVEMVKVLEITPVE